MKRAGDIAMWAGVVGLSLGVCVSAGQAQTESSKPVAPAQPASPAAPAKPGEAAQPGKGEAGKGAPAKNNAPIGTIEIVAELPGQQVTGVAVSKFGRVFVCIPRWHDGHKHSVLEIRVGKEATKLITPYPDELSNTWVEAGDTRGVRFVCVQSVYVDDNDELWILDSGSPRMEGIVTIGEFDGGGPKIIRYNLKTNRVMKVIQLWKVGQDKRSYFNDIRVDTKNGVAFITDSGLGGIIAVEIRTSVSRRVLEGHPGLMADGSFVPVIEGKELRLAGGQSAGKVPPVHSDGIAFDSKNGWLYFQALTSKRLYRVKSDLLIEGLREQVFSDQTKERIKGAVEDLGETVMTDGMEVDDKGRLYFSALEQNAVMVREPDGKMKTLVQDERIAWPDSFSLRDGWLYFTTSQIHRTSWFRADRGMPTEPYRVWRVRVE